LFGPAPFSDIHDPGNGTDEHAVVIEDRRSLHGGVNLAPGLGKPFKIVLFLDAVGTALEVFLGDAAGVGVHEIVYRPAQHFFLAVTQHAGDGRVHQRGFAFGIDDPDTFLGQVEQAAIFFFAAAQGVFHFAAGGDVRLGGNQTARLA